MTHPTSQPPRHLPALDSLLQDLRYTFRTLGRDAGFTTFAILIVGLGIGASSTVFSIVNALLLRPLPFRDPGRLVWIANHDETGGLSGQTTQVGTSSTCASRINRSPMPPTSPFMASATTSSPGKASRSVSRRAVSQNFFPLLGVQPQLGRLFTAEECKWNGPKAVLLSHGLWVRRFAPIPASSAAADAQR